MSTNKVKTVFLGCGGFMGAHAVRLKGHPDAEIVGLCDTKPEITQGFYDRNLAGYSPKPAMFTDPARMYVACPRTFLSLSRTTFTL